MGSYVGFKQIRTLVDGNGDEVVVEVTFDASKFDAFTDGLAQRARENGGKATAMGGAVTVCVIRDSAKGRA